MGEHQSRHTGMGHHHAALGKPDANLRHGEKLVEFEVDADIRQRRIAHGRTDALIFLTMKLLHRKMLMGSIAPEVATNL